MTLDLKIQAVIDDLTHSSSYEDFLSKPNKWEFNDLVLTARRVLAWAKHNGILKDESAKQWTALKKQYPNAYQRWTDGDDATLTLLFKKGTGELELSEHFGRQPSAIRSRLEKLGLVEANPLRAAPPADPVKAQKVACLKAAHQRFLGK
jgi:hypothetical protein